MVAELLLGIKFVAQLRDAENVTKPTGSVGCFVESHLVVGMPSTDDMRRASAPLEWVSKWPRTRAAAKQLSPHSTFWKLADTPQDVAGSMEASNLPCPLLSSIHPSIQLLRSTQ